ncbi:IclR family transcriptional regulator [Microbacterium murale]|uniref:DNA-binding IclR family transcriptional regulator n=1 Tax=Microbacterium murale TaxID=1081040 RepID=A0ABU0P5A5_9MICO|nr:IclR family transcriptional regulator [Microbacterium murale]MDQ0642508.1 DNA-binding IclR family transcriptional regulator [Microbacterium murale]
MESISDNAVSKAIQILSALRSHADGASARELAPSTGFARSTVQRILATLAASGMVIQDAATQRYLIGPQALVIGLGYNGGDVLVNEARPYMFALRDESGETVGLSVAIGHARVFLEEVQSNAEIRFASEMGRLYPLWSGANGRVLMGGLSDTEIDRVLADHEHDETLHESLSPDQVRERIVDMRAKGFAQASNETIANVSSVAVGVRDGSGQIVAALSVSGPAERFTPQRMDEIVPQLKSAASAISARLGAGRGTT